MLELLFQVHDKVLMVLVDFLRPDLPLIFITIQLLYVLSDLGYVLLRIYEVICSILYHFLKLM